MNAQKISQQARRFLFRIKSGRLPKEILPNSAPNYTVSQELRDTDFYVNLFLKSSAYDFVKKCEVMDYNGE